MKTEDDTFNRLRRCTYEELALKIIEHWDASTDINVTYDHILAESGWTYNEYSVEWQRRHPVS
jgi:hypothetical protein